MNLKSENVCAAKQEKNDGFLPTARHGKKDGGGEAGNTIMNIEIQPNQCPGAKGSRTF